MLPGSDRRRTGSFLTPAVLAARLCALSMPAPSPARHVLEVCDPAVGGGSFLIAAARLQAMRRGASLAAAVAASHGLDTDPLAVAVADTALRLLAAEAGSRAAPTVRVRDALARPSALPEDAFDLVVGNPPFLGQLRNETVRSAELTAGLRSRFGLAALGYADTAHVFLLLALDAVREGGQVALILPASFLATRDGAAVRGAVAARARIRWLWRGGEGLFDASVGVCAVGVERAPPVRPPDTIRRYAGAAVREERPLTLRQGRLPGSAPWAWMFADLDGIPDLSGITSESTLAQWCSATADFRDQFYGLAPYVIDDGDGSRSEQSFPRLVTVGLIDPARCLWGRRSTRFAGRVLMRPRVDLAALQEAPAMARWAQARLVPKILLATQTRVLEPVVDVRGQWLPSTPAITVRPTAGTSIWHVAAALAAPVTTAWALERHAGAALSADAIKLGAKQVLSLPAPAAGEAWDRAAASMRAAAAARRETAWRAALVSAARASCLAYRLPVEPASTLVDWWEARLPPWR